MNYAATIEKLKANHLINEGAIVVVCQDAPSAFAMFMGGALGAALSTSKGKHFVMSLNENEIRLFDISKKTGEYLDTYTSILKANVKKAVIAGMLSQKTLSIKCNLGMLRYTVNKKLRDHDQTAEVEMLKGFLKAHY